VSDADGRLVNARFRPHESRMVEIRQARFPDDRASVLDIFTEFVNSPSVSLDFQGNEADFAALPGKYAPPGGAILLAWHEGRVAGCVAMRPVDGAICEMKRLYVRPFGRGLGLGRSLAEAIVSTARDAGYAEMRLDVLPEFVRARAIYAALGFSPAEPVAHNPVPGTEFLGLALR
jgi:GNAT superfamily N-acetyltransferase